MGRDLVGDAELEHMHGKARVRIARVWRSSNSQTSSIVEWNVSISLSSEVVAAFTSGDNSGIVATDTMKNTVYILAKEVKEELSVEEFAIRLGTHFVSTYPKVTGAKIVIEQKPWERVILDQSPHDHGRIHKEGSVCVQGSIVQSEEVGSAAYMEGLDASVSVQDSASLK